MKVYVSYWLPAAPMDNLRQHHTVVANESPELPSPEELVAQLNEADAFLCVGSQVDKAILDQVGPRLKIIANWGVGYNNIDAAYAAEKGIMVTNTPDVLTETTADMGWAILMAVARRVVESDKYVRAGEFHGFKPFNMLGSDVWGKTIGIVGLGRIGQAVARRAKGFGMKIIYYDLQPALPEIEQELGARWNLLGAYDFQAGKGGHVEVTSKSGYLLADAVRFVKVTPGMSSKGEIIVDDQSEGASQRKGRWGVSNGPPSLDIVCGELQGAKSKTTQAGGIVKPDKIIPAPLNNRRMLRVDGPSLE